MKLLKRILPIMLAFVLLFGSCLTVSAAETSRYDLSQFKNLGYSIVVMRSTSNGSWCYVLTSSENFRFGYGSLVTGSQTDGVKYYLYQKNGSDFSSNVSDYTLTEKISSTYGSMAPSGGDVVLLYSSHDVLDKTTDDVVFQAPLPLVALAESLTEAVPRNLKVILPIAVGLLASLMGLTVLRRKFPRFLRV